MKRVILIAGASGGIGKYLTDHIAQGDDDVVVVPHYHTKKRALEHGNQFYADITDGTAVKASIDEIAATHGRIDIMVNAVGISVNAFAHKFDPVEWGNVIALNLVGSFNLVHAVLPHMRKNGYGRIALLSSVVFQRAVMGTSAYSASKAGLVGLTRTVAIENATKGVTCNCLVLGYFNAGMLQSIPPEQLEAIRMAVPMQRFGKLDEVLSTLRFVIDTEYLTGQTISVNGGMATP